MISGHVWPIERSSAVGNTWRRHYDRLHLHTVKAQSGLPDLPMPDDWPRYVSRDQVVAYLESYARHFDIAPRFGCDVDDGQRPPLEFWHTEQQVQGFVAQRAVVS